MEQTNEVPRLFEVVSDGRTVWVNAETGECLGRFGPYGVDIHRTVKDQVAGGSQCLDCTHTYPSLSEWEHFVATMKSVYGVTIGPEHLPTWL